MADHPAVATPIYDEVLRELASEPEPNGAETNGADQARTSATEEITGPE